MEKTALFFLMALFATLVCNANTSSPFCGPEQVEENPVGTEQRSDRKIIEISKIVTLTDVQEKIIRRAVDTYNNALDSALYKVSDPAEAAKIKYSAGKKYNQELMSTLTEMQRNKYITVTSTPEIEAKTDYKVSLLEESGQYSAEEIAKMRTQIFNYLMLEKIVYAREKYNIKKQKENIARLKNIIPAALKASNVLEKIKGQGRSIKGSINW